MRKKRLRTVLVCAVPSLAAALFVWTAAAEAGAHYRPEYERADLETILCKEMPDEEDYAVLFRQTGLGRSGVKSCFIRAGRGNCCLCRSAFLPRWNMNAFRPTRCAAASG